MSRSHPLDREDIERERRIQEKAEHLANQQVRADIQQVMNLPSARRILYAFMHNMGLDASAFSTNAMAQSRSIGRQEAAQWWLEMIREHCPEKEAQIRNEGAEMVRAQMKKSTEDDDQ